MSYMCGFVNMKIYVAYINVLFKNSVFLTSPIIVKTLDINKWTFPIISKTAVLLPALLKKKNNI